MAFDFNLQDALRNTVNWASGAAQQVQQAPATVASAAQSTYQAAQAYVAPAVHQVQKTYVAPVVQQVQKTYVAPAAQALVSYASGYNRPAPTQATIQLPQLQAPYKPPTPTVIQPAAQAFNKAGAKSPCARWGMKAVISPTDRKV